jgi:hypothetical protein
MAVIMAAVLPGVRDCLADGGVTGEIDLEAEYNNRARVPGHPAVMQQWREGAARTR